MDPAFRYLYLHGFASSPKANKASALRKRWAPLGIELEAPSLHQPRFEAWDPEATLEHLLDLHHRAALHRPLRLIGSSFGGWFALQFAQRHPELVDRLFLLCPVLDPVALFHQNLGTDVWSTWQRNGTIPIDGPNGREPLHYEFAEQVARFPRAPRPERPIRILHGRLDPVVPLDSSLTYVNAHPDIKLVMVDDDHSLQDSIESIDQHARAFFRTR